MSCVTKQQIPQILKHFLEKLQLIKELASDALARDSSIERELDNLHDDALFALFTQVKGARGAVIEFLVTALSESKTDDADEPPPMDKVVAQFVTKTNITPTTTAPSKPVAQPTLWGDYSSDEEPSKPAWDNSSMTTQWAPTLNGDFPPLGSVGMPQPPFQQQFPQLFQLPVQPVPVQAPVVVETTNQKPERRGTSTCSHYLFSTVKEHQKIHKDCWYLNDTDSDGMPIGWHFDGEWYRPFMNALIRHKYHTNGMWEHQACTESGTWQQASFEECRKIAFKTGKSKRWTNR